jgi:hypothetical protein
MFFFSFFFHKANPDGYLGLTEVKEFSLVQKSIKLLPPRSLHENSLRSKAMRLEIAALLVALGSLLRSSSNPRR